MRYTVDSTNSEQLGTHIYTHLIPRMIEFAPWIDEFHTLPMRARRVLAHNLAHTWLHEGRRCAESTELEELEADWGAYAILWPTAAANLSVVLSTSAVVGAVV